MKVSLITVTFNSAATIADAVNSVLAQTYPDIEYIIIDGASTDGTTEIIKSFGHRISKFISARDNGIYDALNKGIGIATGEIVGILNSDDFLHDNNVIEKVVNAFNGSDAGAVVGDVQFVDPVRTSKVVRYYSSKNFNTSRFRFGFMPPHPSFYVKREYFEKFGYYKTDYLIASDFELVLRFLLRYKVKYTYLEMPFVSMRTGGISNKSIKSNYTLNREIARACKENGIKTNYLFIYSKYLSKIFEFSSGRIARRNNKVI